jgi:hypothetical protein
MDELLVFVDITSMHSIITVVAFDIVENIKQTNTGGSVNVFLNKNSQQAQAQTQHANNEYKVDVVRMTCIPPPPEYQNTGEN